jgi:O-antigen ligase
MTKVIEIILALVLIGATLAFGGVQPVVYTLAEIALFLTFLVLLVKQTRAGKIHLPVPVWLFLFVAWVGFQLIPLPSAFVALLSPSRVLAPPLGGFPENAWLSLTIYPHDTILVGLKILAYLLAFVLAAFAFDSRKRGSPLVSGLIFLGCFEAVYGLVQYLTGWQRIFTYAKQYNLQEATGTYINRNHFAGLLGLTIPFAVAVTFYFYQVWSGGRHAAGNRRLSPAGRSAGGKAVFFTFLSMIMVLACIFSYSRLGILGILISVLIMALIGGYRTVRGGWTVGVLVFLGIVVSYGVWIGLGPVLGRFELLREPGYLQTEGRVAIWRDSLRLIGDFPVTGTGLGTFSIAFRRYQTALVDKFVDHAHNDYLEFTADTGLVGVSLLFLPILYLLGRMIFSFLHDPQRYRRAVTLGCIGSTLAMLLHTATDFNLQIPANALIFATILGIGYKVSCLEPREGNHSDPRRVA